MLALVGLIPFSMWGVIETFRNANNNVSQWLPQHYEQTRTYQEFRRLFGSDDIAVISWEGCTLDDERLEKLASHLVPPPDERRPGDGSEWFEKVVTGSRALDSLMAGPSQLPREEALRRLEGTLVGPDHKTTCAVVTLSRKGDADRTGALAALCKMAETYCGLSRDELRLGGDAVINAAIDIESKRAIRRWLGLAWGVAMVFAWLSLRRVRLMGMVFVVSIYCALLGTAMVHYTGGTMNLLLVLVPVLLFVLTLSGSVHLSNYYRDTIRESGISGAPVRAMAAGWSPCAMSAATTALGLGSLLVSHIQPVKSFGLYASAGMVLSVGLLFLVLPTLMEIWPLRIPSGPALSRQPFGDLRGRVLGGIACAIIRHRVFVTALCMAALILLGFGAAFLKTTIQPARFFSPKSKWIQDRAWFGRNVAQLVTVEIVLGIDKQSKMNMLERMELVRDVEQEIHSMDEVGGAISAATFAPDLGPKRRSARDVARRKIANRRLETYRDSFVEQGYLNETGREERWRITARLIAGWDVHYDEVLRSVQQQTNRFLQERVPSSEHVQAIYTGSVPLVFAAQQELLRGLLRSFCLAFVLIAIVMILLMRSASAGMLAMLPNIFPTMATFGIMGWVAKPVDVGAMMTASVALGIAVDDTLHYLTWFRRGLLRGDTREEAIVEAYQRCAPAMTQTTLIVGPALLAFFLSSFQPVSQFGLLMFILMLAALFGDLVMLPALLATRAGAFFFRNLRPDAVRPTTAANAA